MSGERLQSVPGFSTLLVKAPFVVNSGQLTVSAAYGMVGRARGRSYCVSEQ
jgi:hypothetical protein